MGIQNKCEKRRIELLIEGGHLITDLSPWEGKYFDWIDAYDADGNDLCIPTDESVWVEDGKLRCSSYNGGLVGWSEEEGCYIHSYHYREEKLHIAGFLDIKVMGIRMGIDISGGMFVGASYSDWNSSAKFQKILEGWSEEEDCTGEYAICEFMDCNGMDWQSGYYDCDLEYMFFGNWTTNSIDLLDESAVEKHIKEIRDISKNIFEKYGVKCILKGTQDVN